MSKNRQPSLFDERHDAFIALIETSPLSALEQLNAGAYDDLDIKYRSGEMLCTAVQNGQSALVKALLAKGAAAQQSNGRALHIAIARGHSNILQDLVYAEPDLSKLYAELLLTAEANGKKGIYNWLVEQEGVHYTLQPELLMAKAAEKGMTGIIDNLIERGYDVNIGKGAALYAAVKGRQGGTVRHLFNKHAKADIRDGVAFVKAASHDMLDTVEAFLKRGVDPNVKNGDALCFAVKNRNHKMAALLLRYNANPDVLHSYPIKEAIKNNDDEMVKLLIAHGAKLNTNAGAIGELAVEGSKVGIFTDLCDAGYNPLNSRRDLLKLAQSRMDPLMEDCVHFYMSKYDYCQQPAKEPNVQDSASVAAARMGQYADYVAQNGLKTKELLETDKYHNTVVEILAAQGKLSNVLDDRLWRGREAELTRFFDRQLAQMPDGESRAFYENFKNHLKLRRKIHRPKLG